MQPWVAFPHAGEYRFTPASAAAQWPRLHAGDAEPLPSRPAVLAAWVLLHNGEFEQAVAAGLAAGEDGVTVANKATCIYASYLEQREPVRLELLQQAAQRGEAQAALDPRNPNAWYWQAYALGRYSQGISVSKALAQGLGSRVKEALEQTIRLQPRHADAHIALGAFHAEVIDKVGPLVAGMTCGASKELGLKLFEEGLAIHPLSAIGMIEYGNALLMLEGEERLAEATAWYDRAAHCEPVDAVERLHVDLARTELMD